MVAAVLRVLFRAELRHRWRSWLLLSLLVALVSGLVLAGVVAARRTTAAFPRYEAAHGYDDAVYSEGPLPGLARLPEVTAAVPVPVPGSGPVRCACSHPIDSTYLSMNEPTPNDLPRVVKLLSGRMPDQADPYQVLASYTLQRDNGVHVGTVLHTRLFAAAQRADALSDEAVAPEGARVALRVVGIEIAEQEFPSTNTSAYDLYTTEAFDRTFNPHSVLFETYLVRLRHGAIDLPQFESRAQAMGAIGFEDLATEAGTVTSAINPQAVGWWILAGLTGLVGIIVVAQALARQAIIESDTFAALSALGVSRRQLVMQGMARTLAVGAMGVVGGVVLAYVLSPLTPVGEARLADPTPGFSFDPLILLIGALAGVLIVLALGLWPSIRAGRSRRMEESRQPIRSSRTVALLTRVGAPPSALIGNINRTSSATTTTPRITRLLCTRAEGPVRPGKSGTTCKLG